MFTYLLQNAFPQGFSPWGFSRRGFSSRDGCSRCSSFASYLPPSHTLRPPFPVTCIVCVVFVECIRLLCNSSLPVSEIPYMCEAQEPGILVSKPLLFFMASCFPLHFPTLSAHFKGKGQEAGPCVSPLSSPVLLGTCHLALLPCILAGALSLSLSSSLYFCAIYNLHSIFSLSPASSSKRSVVHLKCHSTFNVRSRHSGQVNHTAIKPNLSLPIIALDRCVPHNRRASFPSA